MKDISLEEADKRLDDIIEWSHNGTVIENWSDAAGFSAYEATAFAQGAILLSYGVMVGPIGVCYAEDLLSTRIMDGGSAKKRMDYLACVILSVQY